MVKIKEFKHGLKLAKANNVTQKSSTYSLKFFVCFLSIIVLLCSMTSESDSWKSSGLFVSAERQRRRRKEDERDITPSEVEEITDDSTIEDDPDELAKKAMMEEWDTHMSDFVPSDMLSV